MTDEEERVPIVGVAVALLTRMKHGEYVLHQKVRSTMPCKPTQIRTNVVTPSCTILFVGLVEL